MAAPNRTEYLAECLWPGVSETDLSAVDARAKESVAQLSGAGCAVRYLGSLLIREDEVVVCFFEGSATTVREVAERAEIPFERILEATGSRHSA